MQIVFETPRLTLRQFTLAGQGVSLQPAGEIADDLASAQIVERVGCDLGRAGGTTIGHDRQGQFGDGLGGIGVKGEDVHSDTRGCATPASSARSR